MEDKKRKKDDKRKREASQKVSISASPSPGPTPSASPSPATSGPGSAATPSQGGNNAKRLAVANGQPTSTTTQASQQQPRYMPREVPPRFRCQQDHKVLLKRGQPPLSSMLLGGGGGGDGPNANMAAVSDSGAAASSLALTSSSVAASTTTSNYANSMWGASSGSQTSSQGREKVIVDGNDLEEWPSIAGSDGGGASFTRAGGGSSNNGMPVNSNSASGNQSSPTSSFSLPNECMQSSNGVAWGTAASQGHLGGGNAVAAAGPLLQQPSSLSKASAVPGSHDASGPVDGSSGIPGANFNPNANPSAWPALVQQDGPAAAGEGGPSSFHHQGPGGSLSANNSASLGLGGGAVGVLGGHPPLSVNQSSTHQHQLHQMQSRDREMGGGKWDSESAGPKIAGGEGIGGGMDHGVGGGGMSVGDHSLASSWRGQPSYPAANSKTGASRTDGWEGGGGGGTGGFGAAEGDNGTSGWGYPSSTSGANAWGSAGTGGNGSQTSGVSQGGWGSSGVGSERGVSGGDWGGSTTGIGGANPGGEGMGGACSSNSSSSGGSTAGNPPATSSSSSTATTMTRVWDNQKGESETGEWGGGVGGQGARGGSSSSGGNSRNGSGPNSSQSRPRRQAPNAEAALQNLLNRSDLDPRVLSNTGWGQTQIRQNTAWDVDEHGGQSKGGLPSASASKHPSSLGGSSQYSGGPRTQITESAGPGVNPSLVASAGSSGEGWESSSNSSSSGASLSGRAPPPSGPNMRNLGISQSGPVTTTGPGMGSGVIPGHNQQVKTTGWGGEGMGSGDGQEAKGWGNEEWRDSSRGGKGGGWGDLGKQGDQVSGGWGGNQEEKGAGGWKDMGGNGGGSGWGSGQKVGAGRDWGEQESKSNSGGGGWEDDRKNGGGNSGGDSGVGGWGSWDDNAPRRTWGAGGTGGGGSGGGGMGVVGGMGSKPHQNWSGGNKMHQMPNSQLGSITGPQAQLQQQQSQPRNQHPQLQQALDQGAMQGGGGRKPISQAQNQNQSSGWTSGPIPGGPGGSGSGSEPSGWEEPSPQSISRKNEIDDGTSAWGDPTHYNYKPVNLWDKNSGRRQAGETLLPTPSNLSMQDGWGDKEGSVAASRHSSWEDEEEAGGMWNSAGSQGSGSSWGQGSNGGWGDSWMNPINRQFSNMGLLNDDPSGPNIDLAPGSLQEKKMEAEKRGMGMNDYNGDMRKGGRGGGGGMAYRPPGSKEAAPVDPGSYYDKVTSHCHLSGMGQSRHQPNVPPINQSPGIRGQVPHQFLSPQFAFVSLLPPHSSFCFILCFILSVFVQACQLLLQQQQQQPQQQQQQLLQNQRKFTPNVRQQADPQQCVFLPSIMCFPSLEFQPGVPWKGIDRVDPESDPYMTPGSMMGNAVSPNLNDTEHQLLQDNTDSTPPLNTLLPSPGAWPYSASDSPLNNAHNSAKYTDYKTSWPPEPIGHKSWKASRGSSQSQLSRPPPGLASQKQPSPSPWSGGAPRLAGRGWGGGSSSTWSDSSSRESCWLVLSNLTPQIDGSTLRTICMQHGPLLTFHLGLTQGTALIRYGSKQEAAKAQSALHMCVLGNTTILAEFVSEEDVARYIAHSQAGGAGTSSAVGSLDSTGSSSDQSATQGPGLGIFSQWSSNGTGVGGAGGVEAGRQGLWGGMGGMSGAGYPSSSLWGSPALDDRHQMGSPASLLPGDLLGGGADSI
uniref:Trinucleotide repeat-containing gene 6B protein-like n=1 Tax=Seriola dumerili TaxID=41447 RepID=A0A3B4U009_SERDU